MAEAVVLINVDIGREEDVFNKLLELNEVKEVYIVYGVHDIVAVIESPDMDSMRVLITQKIRKIEGVKSTTTSIVIKRQVKR
ncbi:MAG: Lrp/AsnC ligand binding domain-containing protein [Thermoprotei archaeon]|nr:Lrp/AsnC ligand binding domain-containing protein [Thermoprotei archaeon]